MSSGILKFNKPVVVRASEAEMVGSIPNTIRLMADSTASGGVLSTHQVFLDNGADGARPHWHGRSAELFFVVDGDAWVLAGDEVVGVGRGDLVVVPPRLPHAFRAMPGKKVELFIVIAPGVERFEYFRHLQRIASGVATRDSLLALQDLYDTHFVSSANWS